jgi:hypothetical protein
MHGLDHSAVVDDVAFVPECGDGAGGLLGFGVDGAGLGADRSPAALGFDFAMGGIGARRPPAGAGALRHLHQPVLQPLRADGERLKQRVVAGIARHRPILPAAEAWVNPARRARPRNLVTAAGLTVRNGSTARANAR